MKKRIVPIICILSIIIVPVIWTIFFMYDRETISDTTKSNNDIAVYTGSGTSWTKQNNVPTGNYALEKAKSYCENGGIIKKYSPSAGSVTIYTYGQDRCYLYFTNKVDFKITTTSGTGTLCYKSSDRVPGAINFSTVYNGGPTFTASSSQGSVDVFTSYCGGSLSSYITNLGTTYSVYNETNSKMYRYVGANPSNYIWFNDERWRIIGVTTSSMSTTYAPTNSIKIIRAEPIGAFSWGVGNNYAGVTKFTSSNLYKVLNCYYNGNSSCSYAYYYADKQRSSIANFSTMKIKTEWKDYIYTSAYWTMANLSSTTAISGVTGLEYQTSGTYYTNRTASPLGLPYYSDFLYASNSSACARSNSLSTVMSASYYDDCHDNNWLFNENPKWTTESYESSSQVVIGAGYNDIDHFEAYYPLNVYPTLYLKNTALYLGGAGTYEDPIRIK